MVLVTRKVGSIRYTSMSEADTISLLGRKGADLFCADGTCRALDSGTPCDQSCLGTMSFQQQHGLIAQGRFRTCSAPGYRITNRIHPSLFSDVVLKKHNEFQDQILVTSWQLTNPFPEKTAGIGSGCMYITHPARVSLLPLSTYVNIATRNKFWSSAFALLLNI